MKADAKFGSKYFCVPVHFLKINYLVKIPSFPTIFHAWLMVEIANPNKKRL